MFYVAIKLLKQHDDMKAVFVVSRENKLQGNLRYVHLELMEQLPGVKIHFVHAENKMNLKLFKELISFSNARYLILDDYYLPVYLINPDRKMKVIQLWHAAGAFKKFGLSTIGTKFGPKLSYLKLIPIHSNYTHVYVSSENVVPFYADAFNMPVSKIFALGIPRIDMFSNEELTNKAKSALYTKYPELNDDNNINILIAPTYRAVGVQEESNFSMAKMLMEVVPFLNSNVRVLFRPHPYTDKHDLSRLNSCENVIIADNYSLNEWMLVADAFITDYSSAIFDFSLLKKPFAHFVPDFDHYEKNRGFYQDIEQITDGELIQRTSDLVSWINYRTKEEYFNTARMVNYNFSNTKGVTKKVVSHFLEKDSSLTKDLGGVQSGRVSNR